MLILLPAASHSALATCGPLKSTSPHFLSKGKEISWNQTPCTFWMDSYYMFNIVRKEHFSLRLHAWLGFQIPVLGSGGGSLLCQHHLFSSILLTNFPWSTGHFSFSDSITLHVFMCAFALMWRYMTKLNLNSLNGTECISVFEFLEQHSFQHDWSGFRDKYE